LFQAIAINDSLATSDLHIQLTCLVCGTILATKDKTPMKPMASDDRQRKD
jgi:hypothetical protein